MQNKNQNLLNQTLESIQREILPLLEVQIPKITSCTNLVVVVMDPVVVLTKTIY